jgi:hypothetical protein
MRFLLSFAMRNPEIKSSKIVETIRQANQLRLVNDDPNYVYQPGEDINDLDLIPLNLKPFISLKAEVQITGKMRNRKYKVITVPELDEIHKDLFSIIKSIHDATSQLNRVESVVFPRMNLDSNFIQQPDIKNNEKLVFILRMFDKLIGQCMLGCKGKVGAF